MIEAFTLDTSGVVTIPSGPYAGDWTWDRLTPFTQGYVEALHHEWPRLDLPDRRKGAYRWAFSNLAPETLARIMEDCERGVRMSNGLCPIYRKTKAGGGAFWSDRQSGRWRHSTLKPLTPYLGDDGLLYLQGMKEEESLPGKPSGDAGTPAPHCHQSQHSDGKENCQ